MKRTMIGFFALVHAVIGYAQSAGGSAQPADVYIITGQLRQVEAGWVYLIHVKDGQKVIDSAQAAKDEVAAKVIQAQYDGVVAEINDNIYLPFVRNNPASPLALHFLAQYAGADMEAKGLRSLFDGLSKANRDSKAGKAFLAELDIADRTRVGEVAMDFTQNDTAGRPVTLAGFRGRYVLVDFWASWCGPCRAENPNVVKAYARYHDKGFDVLGVSLDKSGDKDKWLKAIHADHLAWGQVSDLQFWNNAVAKEYGVNSIPRNFLIDRQGKIIGKDIRGDDLEKKLAEIFGE